MKKKPASKSAFFNPRFLISFSFCAIGLFLALVAFALYPGGNALAKARPEAVASSAAAPAAPASSQTRVPVITSAEVAAPDNSQTQGDQESMPNSRLSVLVDQTDHPATTATGSRNFEAANSAFSDQAADDFVVPAGQTWTVQQVRVQGLYLRGPGSAKSVNVTFYSDAATLPGVAVPGGTYSNAAMTDTAGNFVITLPSACVLTAGTYWVSVQANIDFNTGGQWGWLDRTVQSNGGAAWQNPGGGLASACAPGWGRRTGCVAGTAPDNVFQILGTRDPDVVLYDQFDSPGANATSSQDFEAANDAFDNQLADDFVVPAGQTWTVQMVELQGVYFNGPGPAASFNVAFYSNAGSNLPGAAVPLGTYPGLAYTNVAGVFGMTLTTPLVLTPGTYWVSVQARMDFTPGGQWGWTDRTITSNSGAAWQNPGGGFATACNAWGRRSTTCAIDPAAPDQIFRLSGTISGASSPTPSPSGTPSPTPTATATVAPSATVSPCPATFSENFDGVVAPALPAGWTTVASGAEVPWVTSTTTPDSAPNDAFAPDPTTIGNTELITPTIAIPAGGGVLTFRNLFNMEAPATGTVGYDGMVLEISISGGVYDDIITAGGSFVMGGYTRTISTGFMSPIAGRMAWSALSAGTTDAPAYITTVVNLPANSAGRDIQLKWRAASDDSLAATGVPGVRIDGIVVAPAGCGSPTPTATVGGTPSATPSPGGCSSVNGGQNPQATSESGVAAPAGFFWSEVQHDTGNNTESNTNAGYADTQGTLRLADNFTLTQACTINSIVFYGYLTGAPATPSPFTAYTLQIHNGRPGDPGVVVVFGDTTTNRLATSVDSTYYRIFNTVVPPPGTAPGTTRKIWRNTVTVGMTLPAGTYWVDWASTVTGGVNHFAPSKTIAGARGAAGDNARQFTGGVWVDVVDAGNPATAPDVPQDFPFEVIAGGGPTPTATATVAPSATPSPSASCSPSWSTGSNAPPVAIVRAVGAYFPTNGLFYAVGGRTADTVGTDNINPFEYNPATNTWATKAATYPDNKVNNMACGVLTVGGTPQIYCVGGSAVTVVGTASRVFSYNPVTDTITSLTAADDWPGSQSGGFLPGGFAVNGNKLYIVGSFNANSVPPAMTNQVWQFDPTAAVGSKWLQRADYPQQRGYVPTASIGGFIYTGGGSALDAAGALIDSVESYKYDTAANAWTAIASIPRATGETRAVVLNGTMWVLGGGRTPPNPSNQVDIYDPVTNSWSLGLPFINGRRNFPADSDGTSRIWLAGGYDTTGVLQNTTERFGPGACASPSPSPSVTATPTATATATATVPGGTPSPTETPSPSGTPGPSVTPGPSGTPGPSATPGPNPTPTPSPAAQAVNFSTRMMVLTGDRVGIGGFIVTGSGPKNVIVRAIGPSLTRFGITDALADPVLELHGPAGFTTIINNNWRDTQQAVIEATGLPPTNDLESAIVAILSPGAYTAVVRGNGPTPTGVALVEVYDLNQSASSKLSNISTRAFVGSGDDIIIAGFILGNNGGDDSVVVRGMGPSLTAAGVPSVLANPTLELRDPNGAIVFTNNDWMDNPVQKAQIMAAGLAPSNNLESAIAATLAPGPYTALLAGLNNTTGIGLVEVYDLGNGVPVPTPTPGGTPTPTSSPIGTPITTPTPGGTPSPTPPGVTPSPTPPGVTPSPTPPPVSPTPTPQPACMENFDGVTAPSLPAGWAASNGSGDPDMWATSTIGPDTAPNDVFVVDQDGISDKYLDSRDIIVNSATATLSFRNNFDTEFSGGTYWDGYVLEVSSPNINGGAFTDVTDPTVGGSIPTGGYTGEIDGTANNPLAGRMAWSGPSGGYINTVVNLGSNVNGQTIKLRFRMGTDEAVAAPGVRLDTLVFTGASCP